MNAQAIILQAWAYDLVLWLFGIVIAYYVIRHAVRDAIRDSGLIEALRHRSAQTPPPAANRADRPLDLPDMRAD